MLSLEKMDVKSQALLFVAKIAGLLAIGAVAYTIRPVFQSIAYFTRYSPVGMVVFGTTFVVALVLYLLPPIRDEDKRESLQEPSPIRKLTIVGLWFTVVVVVGVFIGMVSPMFAGAAHADQTMERADDVETLPRWMRIIHASRLAK